MMGGVDTAGASAHMVELKRELGQRLADLRRAAEVTQSDVARHTFVDRTYVSHAEHGRQLPERAFWVAADEYLAAEGRLCGAYDELVAVQHAQKHAELDELRARYLQPQNIATNRDAENLRCELFETFGPMPTRYGDAASAPPDLPLTAAHTVHAMEAFSAHDLASRRQVLRQLSVLSGGALLRPVRRWISLLPVPISYAIDSADLDQLEDSVRLFRSWDAAGMGGLKRKAVVGQLKAVAEAVLDAPSGAKPRLFHILAEFAELAGWMSFDQGLHGAAQRYYLLALHACREAGAVELSAHVIGDLIKQSNAAGRYDDGLHLAQAGLYVLPPMGSSLVRTELLSLQAQGYAGLGSDGTSHAIRSIETGFEIWHDRAGGEAHPDWLHHMTQAAEVHCGAANTYTELALAAEDRTSWQRLAERAEEHTLKARQARSDRYLRSRVIDEIRLARVRLAQREPEEGVAVATHALDMSQNISSSIIRTWIGRFHRELSGRYGDLPRSDAFTERVSDYLGSAASVRTDRPGNGQEG